MAVVLKFDTLTQEQKEIIADVLTMIPLEKEKIPGQKSFEEVRPITLMFKIFDDDKYIRLPYSFACKLFNKKFNLDKPHIRMINDGVPEFAIPLLDRQVPIVAEAIQQLEQHNTTTLHVFPGFGKTIMATKLCHSLGFVTLVTCTRKTLITQWYKTFCKCIPAYKDYIWIVGDQPLPAEGTVPPLIICMAGRIGSIPEYIRASIGTLMVDEAHMFCTPSQVETLLYLEPKYIILQSATLNRQDGMDSMVRSVAGTHEIYRKCSVPYLFMAIETGFVPETKMNKIGSLDYSSYIRSQSESYDRNIKILDIVRVNLHKKFMILTRLKEHVKTLQTMFTQMGMVAATLFGNQSSYSDSPILIGTIPKMGTGFDEATSCDDFQGVQSDVLILATSVKEYQLYEQLRGRVMRCNRPTVIWLLDDHGISKNHLKGLQEWITSTSGLVYKVPFRYGEMIIPDYKG
jgi:superfamily II DNA or RNA helicase